MVVRIATDWSTVYQGLHIFGFRGSTDMTSPIFKVDLLYYGSKGFFFIIYHIYTSHNMYAVLRKGIDGGAVQDVIRNRLSRAFIIATALIVGGQMMYFIMEAAASLSIPIATPTEY